MQTCDKGAANLRNLQRGGGCDFSEHSDFEAKIRAVNAVSGEKMHDLETIFPASGVRYTPNPRTPCV